MSTFIVAGAGTEVGKTVVSAILTQLLEGEYWKPIQSGAESDSDTAVMAKLIDSAKYRIHPPAYSFKAPLSPHHAARLEGREVDISTIRVPKTTRPLVIEGVGGALVPLNLNSLSLDLFKRWGGKWIVVSRHYLGSINHTLLTIQALKHAGVNIGGIVFNGEVNPDTESAIMHFSGLPVLGRVFNEPVFNSKTIQKYANQWKQQLFLP